MVGNPLKNDLHRKFPREFIGLYMYILHYGQSVQEVNHVF
jgi:hypothetical protein